MVASPARAAKATEERRPNILFALADDWGWPHAGALGDKVVRTPTFDRLAREGALLKFAFVSSPSCTPSRNSLITGQHFFRLGEGANLWSTLDSAQPNFVMLLRESGYEIGHHRKAWGPGDYAAGGYTEHPCGPAIRFGEFMEKRDRSKPFFFWFGTSDPHRPYAEGAGRAAGVDAAGIRVPGFLPDNEVVRADLADYYSEIERFDREVGEAMAILEAAGELDNTIIVMSGDNGMPFPRSKGNLYDWGVRVPLAVRWRERIPPGRQPAAFVSFADIAPTFLDAASVAAPESMTGESILPILEAPQGIGADGGPSAIVFGRERHTAAQTMPSMDGYPSRAIRTRQWLLILNLEPDRWPAGVPSGATHPMDVHSDCDDGPTKALIVAGREKPAMEQYYKLCFAKRPEVELYDCDADPDQIENVASDPRYAGIVEDLKGQLVASLVSTGDPRFTDAPVMFDDYPYRAEYMRRHLEQHGFPVKDR